MPHKAQYGRTDRQARSMQRIDLEDCSRPEPLTEGHTSATAVDPDLHQLVLSHRRRVLPSQVRSNRGVFDTR